jgi:thioredoxin 1
MALKIEILGANCSKCSKLFDRTLKIVQDNNLDTNVEKITDNQRLLSYGIYVLPALVINDKVVSKGVSLSEKQIIIQINAFLPENEKITIPVKSNKLLYKNPLIIILFFIVFAVILSMFFIKNKRPDSVISALNSNPQITLADSVDFLYNYSKNGSSFQLTFLEFGSVGCIECKKMEKVLEEVKVKYPNKINVVFYNARIKRNKKFFGHFGIEMIPVQVLLDKNGRECFRHLGFYSYEELKKEFIKNYIHE